MYVLLMFSFYLNTVFFLSCMSLKQRFQLDFLVFQGHFQRYFSYIMATSFSGGRSRVLIKIDNCSAHGINSGVSYTHGTKIGNSSAHGINSGVSYTHGIKIGNCSAHGINSGVSYIHGIKQSILLYMTYTLVLLTHMA